MRPYILNLSTVTNALNFREFVRDTISCVFLPRTVGANSVYLRHETKNPLQLKGHYQKPRTLENKNVPILRSQNTQNTQTPLKTGSEQSVQLLFIRQWNFDPFQMDQPKTLLTSNITIIKHTQEN